ncbi:bifunctional salicylyl-CoA 5-hydroxylase/oxidoreductase [Vulgatibacter incomptus]|uniref:Anthraniloyl-CoA monooxygenase n=1 Tax=Vulgatibacter incomptus TaxID=1391653 RepID=A0A0K1PF82_9BACT|nr:bifunctional salicylyl-CoA 5-hydroxylase/oxidoreductase [Vulgatibacter incomptus]AKU92167.1 Anthraniloyl-CoA monooxygenase [Vulgatibacter incomptus]
MRVLCVGGGPAGLYLSILLKKANPRHEVTILERNAADQTFGWGVVFSDETLGNLLDTDPETHDEITRAFAHWDAIDIHVRGERIRSTGHGFSGIARKQLLRILQRRAVDLGVQIRHGVEVDDPRVLEGYDLVVGADGIRSRIRAAFEPAFGPSLDVRKCRYIWLGTRKVFDAFTFIFEENEHGLFQVHAYRFDPETSTFIVECDEESWKAAGLDRMSEKESLAYLERLFARHLDGHGLMANHSTWVNFATVRNERWHHGNVVLIGDAAHTAHFSIGSGTKLAIEDSIALADALSRESDVPSALALYESERRGVVERTQKAAQDSLRWFENVKRYRGMEPLQLAFSLLSRSKRISWENLRLRDPRLVSRVDEWFARRAGVELGEGEPAPPPMFTPFRLRGMELKNRVVVSPMCMYSAEGGTPNDFHLAHLVSRAMGGAGLVFAEMTNVSPEGRITPGCTGIYDDAHTAAWKRIVDAVRACSDAKIALQLGHAGRKAATRLPWEAGADQPLPEGAWEIVAPSPLPYLPHSQVPREVDRADMDRLVAAYVQAAKRADQAGFDMLEIHFAHGYLLSSFLSPLTNVRRDRYGGTLENRMRFPLEVFEAVRATWPEDKPISVRISATDWVPGGFHGDDAVVVAKALKALGCDIVDVSTGQTTPMARPVYGRMWQARFADQVRHEAGIPTITVGNITTGDQVNTLIAAGRADLCALARPHLSDPHWTLHAAAEVGFDQLAWPSPYRSGKPRRQPTAPGVKTI